MCVASGVEQPAFVPCLVLTAVSNVWCALVCLQKDVGSRVNQLYAVSAGLVTLLLAMLFLQL